MSFTGPARGKFGLGKSPLAKCETINIASVYFEDEAATPDLVGEHGNSAGVSGGVNAESVLGRLVASNFPDIVDAVDCVDVVKSVHKIDVASVSLSVSTVEGCEGSLECDCLTTVCRAGEVHWERVRDGCSFMSGDPYVVSSV